MKLGTDTGSLVNYLMSGTNDQPTPVVGMGATLLGWTDRHAYTVIEVHPSRKKIVVQRDRAVRSDSNGMSENQDYEYIANPNGSTLVLKLNKDGKWRTVGGKKNGRQFAIGYREEYHDYSF